MPADAIRSDLITWLERDCVSKAVVRLLTLSIDLIYNSLHYHLPRLVNLGSLGGWDSREQHLTNQSLKTKPVAMTSYSQVLNPFNLFAFSIDSRAFGSITIVMASPFPSFAARPCEEMADISVVR